MPAAKAANGAAAGDDAVVVGVTPTHEVAWHSKASGEEVLRELGTSLDGLSSEEAVKRLAQYGPNALTPPKKPGACGGPRVLVCATDLGWGVDSPGWDGFHHRSKNWGERHTAPCSSR